MRSLLLISVLSSACLTSLALVTQAHAQQQTQQTQETQQDSQSVAVSAGDSRISLPDNYHTMRPREFDSYMGQYDLSNGMTLAIFTRGSGGGMYAAVSGYPPHKMAAVSGDTFVALDRQLRMHINLSDPEEVSGDVLMVVPDPTVASGEKLLRFALR